MEVGLSLGRGFRSVMWARIPLLVPLVLTSALMPIAKAAEESSFWSVTPHTGPLLPNQVDGISEIMPTAGLNLGLKAGRGLWELGTYFSNAYGAGYHNVAASYRIIMPMEGLEAHLFGGLDFVRYRSVEFDTRSTLGAHAGVGVGAPLGSGIVLRTDMKFNVNPGTSLYVGFGLEVRTALGGSSE